MSLFGARRPRYGGTLRLEIGAPVASLDPSVAPATEEEAAAKERLISLVYDPLVRLDAQARPVPGLAESWQLAPDGRTWNFVLREGMRFQDGSFLTPADAAASLQPLERRWALVLNPQFPRFLTIVTGGPEPDLPAQLANSRYVIYHRTAEGALLGTGAFRPAEWEPRRHARFTANDFYWEGRPFLDAIDVQMGIAVRQRLIDLELRKADLADLPPESVRRSAEQGVRLTSSHSAQLLALVFTPDRPAAEDARLRQSLALSIDRAAIVSLLLQRQAEPAGALLPQWLSGTAFLFHTAPDLATAKRLAVQMGSSGVVHLGYDSADALEQSVAERIAVNARDAGLSITAQALKDTAGAPSVDARILRMRMHSPLPRLALDDFFARLQPVLGADAAPLSAAATAQEIYARERAAVDTFRVVPLVHLPDVYGVGARVRDWMLPAVPGERRGPLADVWLEDETP